MHPQVQYLAWGDGHASVTSLISSLWRDLDLVLIGITVAPPGQLLH